MWGAEEIESGNFPATALTSENRAALWGAERPISLSHVPGMAKDNSVAWRKQFWAFQLPSD